MAEKSTENDVTIEQLRAELAERRRAEAIKDSMILEYRQALGNAQCALAIANGQLKLATQPTE